MTSTLTEIGLTEADLEKILHDLNSRDNAVYEAAVKQARALPPETLLGLSKLEMRNYRKRQRIFRSVAIGLSIIGITFLIAHYLFGIWHFLDSIFPVYFIILFSLQIAESIRQNYVPTRVRRSFAKIIEEIDDLRFLSIVLALQREMRTDPIVVNSVYKSLRRLVPQFVHAFYGRFPPQEMNRALLLILAEPYKDVELTLSSLKALEQIGDASVIPAVERLAAEPPATPNMKRVREAAKECLPYLRAHADEVKQTQTLLRPSDSATSGTESLLRPATQTGTETSQGQLLRAVDLSETQALSNPHAVQESAPLQEQRLNASNEES